MNPVPVLRIEHLNPDEIRAYIIADNRLAEKSGWDRALLAIELHGLSEIGFEIDAIGFEPAELDIVLEEADEAAGADGPDDIVPVTEKSPVSGLGLCGFAETIACSAVTQEMNSITSASLTAARLALYSLTRPTTSKLPVTFRAAAMTSSLWRAAK